MRDKRKLIALAAAAVAVGVGGTFAYFNQTLTASNIFDTGTYDTELVEEFRPSDGENWEPGVTINKDVTVKNLGTLPVVARVKFEEKWVRRATRETLYEIDSSADRKPLDGSAANKFESVYQTDPEDGKTGADVDDSVVFKTMNPDGGWIYNPADGYYYYSEVLPGTTPEDGTASAGNASLKPAETTKLLDSVTLAENVDMGAYRERKYYATTKERPQDDGEEWIEFATRSNASPQGYEYLSTREMNERLKETGQEITFMKAAAELKSQELAGYSQADYTLKITAQTVQATAQAVQTAFGNGEEFIPPEGVNWELAEEGKTQKGQES